MKLAIIGDFDSSFRPHIATNEAIDHVQQYLKIKLDAEWIPTSGILADFKTIIDAAGGFWIAPGSPYKSMAGALEIIKFARLNNIPALGTCGGFQHMVIEFARNVLLIKDGAHAEYDPYASEMVVNRLSCSLAGKQLKINIHNKQSLTHKIFNTDTVEEKYYCNFGLNPAYQGIIDKNGFKVVGTDDAGEARILELENHQFFIATLFVPQDNSTYAEPHKLIKEFVSIICRRENILRKD